jgi:hypothetical protein
VALPLAAVVVDPSGSVARDLQGDMALLAFVESWLTPRDYVWSRTSISQAKGLSGDPVKIRDYGRVRIELLRFGEESAILSPVVLKLEYESDIPGQGVGKHTSPLEGEKLPSAWLHPALGFSVGVEPEVGARLGDDHQVAEVLELLDFRGFVPKQLPKVGATWTARFERIPDEVFSFREENERSFEVLSMEEAGENTLYEIQFTEKVTTTPKESAGTSELRSRQGRYKVLLPIGLIEEVSWTGKAEEWFQSGSSQLEVETTSEVSMVRREVVNSEVEPAEPKKKVGLSAREIEQLPRPPR